MDSNCTTFWLSWPKVTRRTPRLRWGDFEDIRLGTFEEIRDAFAQVAQGPVSLEAVLIDVVDK
jgi:hypothetical protein